MNNLLNIPINLKPESKAEFKRENTKTFEKANSNASKDNKMDDFKNTLAKVSQRDNSSDAKETEELHTSEKVKENIENIENIDSSSSDAIINSLQQFINGDITSKDFIEKLLEEPEALEKLSAELCSSIMALLQVIVNPAQNSNAPEVLTNNTLINNIGSTNIERNLKNLIEEFFKYMPKDTNSENYSFENLVSKLSEDILPELKGSNPIDDSELKDHIINAIKLKLTEGYSNKSLEINKPQKEINTDSGQDAFIIKPTLKSHENSGNNGDKDFLGKGNNEDKFLEELASGNKKESNPKVDKVLSFMNGFQKVDNTNVISKIPDNITINKDTFAADIIKSVKFMEQNNMKEMTVKIMPKELGEVVIKLTLENGLMKANITASNKEAYNLLNSNLQELNNKLANNGEIKIQNFTIDIYNGDTTFFSKENREGQNSHGRNQGNGPGIAGVNEEIEDITDSTVEDLSKVNVFV